MTCKTNSVDTPASVSSSITVNELGVDGPAQSTPRSHAVVLEEIWRTHAKRILRITQRITNNREDAEDALQDSFLRAYVYLPGFDGRSSIATWLTRIAINSALMILRRRNAAPQLLSVDEGADPGTMPYALNPVDHSANPETQYAGFERQAMVRHAIAALRPSLREALELQTAEERSVKEVAEKMGLSISATKSRIFHAKAALRESLERKVGPRSATTKQLQLLAA